jgi:NAD(P)H-dependent flavin oxidoreductase YrpB (nitropropane dioxygenase family)
MALPNVLKDNLRLPVVGAPLFIISHPALVIAQCKAGIIGAFPALNARPISQLDEWLHEITEALAAHDRVHPESPAAPFAVARWDPPIMSGRAPSGAVLRSPAALRAALRHNLAARAPPKLSAVGACHSGLP